VIETFPEASASTVPELYDRARRELSRGDLRAAKRTLEDAVGQVLAREDDYVACARLLAEVYRREDDPRAALTVLWYAGPPEEQKKLLERVPAVDRARTRMAWALAPVEERAELRRAASELEKAGLVARAAVARERAEEFAEARSLWSRLADLLDSTGSDPYAAALARFNVARTAKRCGDAALAREATVGAVHLIEEAADRFEQIAQRERAFDCYQVLIAIGRESGAFEHVLEGYVNVIRILREDSLRYYALQTYEEAIEAARHQGESAAAATLAREMASYARAEGLADVANQGVLTEAQLWREVASRTLGREGPPEIAENALLAAVLAFGEMGQFGKVGELYRELGELPLEPARKAHYARASQRYVGARDERVEASPLAAHLRHQTGYPEVWHVDLLEWEAHGSAAEACADVLLDARAWSEPTRRRAMLGRLVALAAESERPATTQAAVALADQLSRLELYAILAPLEHLFARGEPEVRTAVVQALARFLFKRTFITIRAALADADPRVRRAAADAVENLHFPHALDALARIYREAPHDDARAAALRAIARIDTGEAAELMLGVLEHGTTADRGAAVEALRRAPSGKFVRLAKEGLADRPKAVREALKAIVG
jgi:DNA-binding phage protein